MDSISQIVSQTVWISLPEFIRLLFAGFSGGLIGAYINDRLTRRREAEAGRITRQREFLVFLSGWRQQAESIVFRYDAIDHFPRFFNDTIPVFCSCAETIRRDFSGTRLEELQTLTGAISSPTLRNHQHPDKYKEWLQKLSKLAALTESIEK